MKLNRRHFFGAGLAAGAAIAAGSVAAEPVSTPPPASAARVGVDEIVGLNFKGPYSPVDNYVPGDVVSYRGGTYVCAGHWLQLAAPGCPGVE